MLKILSLVIVFFSLNINLEENTQSSKKYGIVGQEAPTFDVKQWIDKEGNPMEEAIQLTDNAGKVKVIYGFQSWCPGCHSHGLPALQKMVKVMEGNNEIAFLAIQTVFEGHSINTFDKIIEVQQKYDLKIPFGHDTGDESTRNRSNIMYHYRTGGTPWFIIIDQDDKVIFNDFHVDVNKTIDLLKKLSSS